MQNWDAENFYDWCVTRNACPEGLAAIKGISAADWWDTTERGDWMEWLYDHGAFRVMSQALAEYEREYERVMSQALAEYERVMSQALAEYERVKAQAWRTIIPNPFRFQAEVRSLASNDGLETRPNGG